MNITAASNPVYSKPDNSQITCVIVCELGTIPFTASADDPMPYGAALFHDFISGKYGAIAPYAGSSFEASDVALAAQIPPIDLASQVAHLTAAIVANGIALPDDVVAAANLKLTAIGQPVISAQLATPSKGVLA